jgi:WD40 repeat protein
VVSLQESLPEDHPNLIITDTVYSPHRNEFAIATSDGQVFVRQFALDPEGMHLVRTLKGHQSEVTQVCWSGLSCQWVTGSADGTVRLWPGASDSETAEMCTTVGDPVSVMCVDQITGCIVVAVQNTLKMYNRSLELVQVSRGHSDVIRSIIHIPDRKQYVSSSWDGTVRVWRAYS